MPLLLLGLIVYQMDRLGAAAARNHGREAARARLTALALKRLVLPVRGEKLATIQILAPLPVVRPVHTVERLDARVAVEADGIAVPTVNDLCPTVLSL